MMIILFVLPRCQFDNTLYKSCTTEGGSLSDSKYYTFFILEVMTDVNFKKKMVKCQDQKVKYQ